MLISIGHNQVFFVLYQQDFEYLVQFFSPFQFFHFSAFDTIEVFLQTFTLKTSINGE